jgi:hypothetical protein
LKDAEDIVEGGVAAISLRPTGGADEDDQIGAVGNQWNVRRSPEVGSRSHARRVVGEASPSNASDRLCQG